MHRRFQPDPLQGGNTADIYDLEVGDYFYDETYPQDICKVDSIQPNAERGSGAFKGTVVSVTNLSDGTSGMEFFHDGTYPFRLRKVLPK